jgi:UDP-glucose 4-epimerase
MQRYLVTGGAGFIGSHLVEALSRAGHSVRVLDDLSTGCRAHLPRGVELVQADVADPAIVRRAMEGVAGCFHLAAIASVARCNEEWFGAHRVNLGGTVAVLDAARAEGGLPVVYASSAAVYGDVVGVAAETVPCRPRTAYGADKLGSELHAHVATLVHSVPTVGLRFFNVFGPRQDPRSPYSGVISIFTRMFLEDRPVTVHGDGRQSRDFVYVTDVVTHLLAAMRHAHHRGGSDVLNVCTGAETSILELAFLLGEVLERGVQLRHAPARLGDIRRSIGSPDRAAAALGVRAMVGLREGLSALVAELHQPSPHVPSRSRRNRPMPIGNGAFRVNSFGGEP